MASIRAFEARHANDPPVDPNDMVQFSQNQMDAATKPLHVEIERLRAAETMNLRLFWVESAKRFFIRGFGNSGSGATPEAAMRDLVQCLGTPEKWLV